MTTPNDSTSFIEGGRRHRLADPGLMPCADADLWNERLHLKLDHTGRAAGNFLQPNATPYAGAERTVYLKDRRDGTFWSAPFGPVHERPEHYAFEPGLHDIRWLAERGGVRVEMTVRVPPGDPVELWEVRVENTADEARAVSCYPFFATGFLGLLDHRSQFDPGLGGFLHRFFPYYVKIDDYHTLKKRKNLTYCLADRAPVAWEGSRANFGGFGGTARPRQLAAERLENGQAVYEDGVCAFQYDLDLAPGAAETFRFILGPASDEAEVAAMRARHLSAEGFAASDAGWAAVGEACPPALEIGTPEKDFDAYVNHWQPNRALMIGRTLRFNPSPQGRNAIQDAMSAALVDPVAARKWFLKIWTHQHEDGFLPHGMPMVEGAAIMPITTIPHKDTNVWGPDALDFYLRETGDEALLHEAVPFSGGRKSATVYEHVGLGLDWLLGDRTARGLSRIGQGDWNDPFNMAGPKEKGESIWLTEALAYALDVWAGVSDRLGDGDRASRGRAEAEACREAVRRHAWDGRWYCRAFTDAGRKVGGADSDEGRIFLNAQSWAILSGAADEAQIDSMVEAVEEFLWTPAGPMTLAPPFGGMVEDVGKLTLKTPGTGENGSVYCHAVTFWACALFRAGRSAEGWRALRVLLPRDTPEALARSGQLPIYIPNFYRGAACGTSAGRSSRSPNTGTSAWYYRTLVESVFGLRAGWDELEVAPSLPAAWPEATALRRWRGANYRVAFRRDPSLSETQVLLDGHLLKEGRVPQRPAGSEVALEVHLPAGARHAAR